MPELSGTTYSESDASNNAAVPNGMPEGMAPSGINDSWRAGMGAVMRFWGRVQGKYASSGSANAYVLSPTASLGAYATGERYSFRANFANTGAATLAISSLTAQNLKKMTGSGKATLASGDIQNGQSVTVEFDGTDLVMVTPTSTGVSDLSIILPTGLITPYVGATAPSGWVLADGKTIGDASSNGTERANPDTTALFTLLYNSWSDTTAPLLTSAGAATTRGAQGAASSAYAAHCQITLPDLRGRVVAGLDNLGGTGATRLGTTVSGGLSPTVATTVGGVGGEPAHTLSIPEMPSHSHTLQQPDQISVAAGSGEFGNAGGATNTGVTGGGGAHNTTQPTIVMGYVIKL